MIITQTSQSQVTSFDHEQEGGCELRFWFERVHDLKPDQGDAQSDGSKGHTLLADYFPAGQMPAKRVKMGKHVTAAILKGELPKPGPDLLVEERFDGQAMWRPLLDAEGQPVLDEDKKPAREYIPLDKANTYWLAGLPWDGAIDLAYRRSDRPTVLDFKFSSDPDTYAKTGSQLIKTIQMPIYVASQIPYWPDAREWEIKHYYIKRSGIQSFMRSAIVTTNQVLDRVGQIAAITERMKSVALAPTQNDVRFNRRSCNAWGGCPHQSVCIPYRENKIMLSQEDQDLFNELDGLEDAPAAPTLQEADTKAARIARAKAELAALEAAEAPAAKPADTGPAVPPPRRKLLIQDVAAEPIPDSAVTCGPCGSHLVASNSSKLTNGKVVHIGCPAAPAAVTPPDAPASKPELASEQPAAPKVPKARAPKSPPAPSLTVPTEPPITHHIITYPSGAGAALMPEAVVVNPPTLTITLHFTSPAQAAAFLAKIA